MCSQRPKRSSIKQHLPGDSLNLQEMWKEAKGNAEARVEAERRAAADQGNQLCPFQYL